MKEKHKIQEPQRRAPSLPNHLGALGSLAKSPNPFLCLSVVRWDSELSQGFMGYQEETADFSNK